MSKTTIGNGRGMGADYSVASVIVPAATGTCGSPSCSCPTGVMCAYVCDATTSNQPACDVTIQNLAPGEYVNSITVSSTGQLQYQRGLIVNDLSKAASINWTAFNTVLSVNQYGCGSPPVPCDHTDYVCSDGSCTLRDAIEEGKTKPGPVLITFDPSVFPAATAPIVSPPANAMHIIQDAGNEDQGVDLTAAGMVIDGTDSIGNPAAIDLPQQRIYSRWVQIDLANNLDKRWNGTLKIEAPNVSLLGLHIQRVVPSAASVAKDQDVIDFYTPATNSSVNLCQIDGGAGDKTASSTGRDCIEAQGGGSGGTAADFSQANLVQDTEISNCWDKGIKVSGSATGVPFLRVEDSWVHDTIDTAVQATLSGQLRIKRSLVERAGFHAGTPTPVNVSANGISANGAYMPPTPTPGYIPTPAMLISEGNISRTNPLRNFFIRNVSRATLTNDYSCGAFQNGITVDNPDTATAPVVSIAGTASVFNTLSGLAISNQSTVGTGGPNNAFTGNSSTQRNVNNGSTLGVTISQSQWEHCYPPPTPGQFNTCNETTIAAQDKQGNVSVSPSKAHQADAATLPVSLSGIYPTKVAKAGAIVRITGSGFNAIDGHVAGGNCDQLGTSNTCTPLQGTCVEFLDTSNNPIASQPEILGITPTEIILKSPVACAQPIRVRVKRRDGNTGIPVVSDPTTLSSRFCVNP
jgi:hypothetical protein